MENSAISNFDDRNSEWYLAAGQQWLGPVTAQEIAKRVLSGKITLAHFIWRKGQKDWQRICDTVSFKALLPDALPPVSQPAIVAEMAAVPPPAPSEVGSAVSEDEASRKMWFVHLNNRQLGPVSSQEIEAAIASGQLTERAHVWRKGMAQWARLESVAHFSTSFARVQPSIAAFPGVERSTRATEYRPVKREPSDQRRGRRRALSAKVLLANRENLMSGHVRDISAGGMQVLAEQAPGQVGDMIRLNVSPEDQDDSGSEVLPFVAEGRIVRVLEDGRGFSFRFERISDGAKRAIEAFVGHS